MRKWSSDRFGDFPITSEDINNKYIENNGDCIEYANFNPVTDFVESANHVERGANIEAGIPKRTDTAGNQA